MKIATLADDDDLAVYIGRAVLGVFGALLSYADRRAARRALRAAEAAAEREDQEGTEPADG